jgi:hypothetical protein
MARFRLVTTHVFGSVQVRAGTVVADSVANALPGDFVWSAMSPSALSPEMTPLDGAAINMRAASVNVSRTPQRTFATGAESIG